jgi:hypothetical protein
VGKRGKGKKGEREKGKKGEREKGKKGKRKKGKKGKREKSGGPAGIEACLVIADPFYPAFPFKLIAASLI